ncbi:LacI family DNA-binding transcriptional regulator [Deinococcus detaillensis]|uniref:LacI family DNA-binding transcriptional regulator n=1 Tax=Deinococcus detaillensis TaxID=2592048 RepID=A0A553V4M8_9DEIO|nr:LacI family DNA-binding transcriptional regulator [Deinococcus detaillensis]TSA87443.1 LacI family DNA-binding transcriptional regulator [Deinococcus detaillensis]
MKIRIKEVAAAAGVSAATVSKVLPGRTDYVLRTEDEAGVWAFARGCMRTDLMLKEKARQFNDDSEIQAALSAYRVEDTELEALSKTFSPENAQALKNRTFDRSALGARGPGLEHLDQLTIDLILGMR